MKTLSRLVILVIALLPPTIVGAKTMEQRFVEYGLVDIHTLDKSVIVDLKYATTDNFTHKNMYGTLNKAYLRPEIAKMLVKVQTLLKKQDKHYSLIVYDAARPVSAQRRMYDLVKDTPNRRYVARPARGGHHNFGIAVDVSIAYNGKPIDMGSSFDSFGTVSHIDNEQQLIRTKRLTKNAYSNRQLLRSLMREAGFTTYRREWWHFQHYDIKYARKHFRLLDF